jgi:hypothetical protein
MTLKKTGKYRPLLFILIFGLTFTSCSDESEIKSHLKEIGIELTDKISVNKCEAHGITDFVLESEFKVTDQDKKTIINLIQQTKDFNKNLPIISYSSNNWTNGSYNDSTYTLTVRTPTKEAFIQHDLQLFYKTNVVKYDYWEE